MSLKKPNTRPVPDPENACSLEIAKMIASGKLTPSEAILLQQSDDDDDDDYTVDSNDMSIDSINSDFSLFDNYESEMAQLLSGLPPKLQDQIRFEPEKESGLLACSC